MVRPRLVRDLPIDLLFSLIQAGWPQDILMAISVQRFSDVENMSFGAVPSPGQIETPGRRFGDFHPVAFLPEVEPQQGADRVLVVDDQHVLAH